MRWRALSVSPSVQHMNGTFRTKHCWAGVCVCVCAGTLVCGCVLLCGAAGARDGAGGHLIVLDCLLLPAGLELLCSVCVPAVYESARVLQTERGNKQHNDSLLLSEKGH